MTNNRELHEIARDISANWKNVHRTASPYLNAMRGMGSIKDSYGYDSGKEIVTRFLANAGSWRGEDARRIKAELRGMLK